MGEEPVNQFDAARHYAEALANAKLCAQRGARKAKAGGGIGAAAPAIAKDVSDAFGEGGEIGARKAYLAVCCSSKALADMPSGAFETVECEVGKALAPSEKRALFQELRMLVDDSLEGVVESALTLGDFHLGSRGEATMLRELSRPEPIATSIALFGPAAMREAKPRVKMAK